MLRTAFSDPGNLMRKDVKALVDKPTFNLRRKIRMNQLGFICKYKICDSCFIIKPLRSSHCPDCNNCVERFDHHCPWIGTCVAKRNYPYFYKFIVWLNILIMYLIGFSIAHIVIFVDNFRINMKGIIV
jgi:hypothetical protein